ncbi:DUF1657 domain-containing protein [Metabacillus litoralis]|uniref:DUF1657 domain-containing protein n=1 Tax=Metabacillus litoralis TaxID=152268 RepID=UPI002040ABCC|nr:DUF1657 domain-containing protein [Metabacillus litoralis]MCM3651833.1 DUF1657 domain-containing protein [Metabacillus litoralis]
MTVGAQVKQCLSTVKGIEASLSSLAITSQDEDSKRVFHEMMMVMEEVKEDLKIRVGHLEREEFQYKGF